MKKYSSVLYPDQEIERVADKIRNQFKVSKERSVELAIEAMCAMDSHGGNPCNHEDMQKIIDVVVNSWINQENDL